MLRLIQKSEYEPENYVSKLVDENLNEIFNNLKNTFSHIILWVLLLNLVFVTAVMKRNCLVMQHKNKK